MSARLDFLVERVTRALLDSGLPAQSLVLEISESTLMLNVDAGLARIHSLKEIGVKIALDDYGMGYSSLDEMSSLSLDMVKIERSFVDRLSSDQESDTLIKSIIDAATALGITCVAEGVERSGQRDVLAELGCRDRQGYLFAKPAPAHDAAIIFRALGTSQSTAL